MNCWLVLDLDNQPGPCGAGCYVLCWQAGWFSSTAGFLACRVVLWCSRHEHSPAAGQTLWPACVLACFCVICCSIGWMGVAVCMSACPVPLLRMNKCFVRTWPWPEACYEVSRGPHPQPQLVSPSRLQQGSVHTPMAAGMQLGFHTGLGWTVQPLLSWCTHQGVRPSIPSTVFLGHGPPRSHHQWGVPPRSQLRTFQQSQIVIWGCFTQPNTVSMFSSGSIRAVRCTPVMAGRCCKAACLRPSCNCSSDTL